MTPTLTQEARTFFQEREDDTHTVYTNCLKYLAPDDLPGFWDCYELRREWQQAHADWKHALAATPCTHQPVERQHTAQRCDYCWMISTYVRLSTPKEIEDDERATE